MEASEDAVGPSEEESLLAVVLEACWDQMEGVQTVDEEVVVVLASFQMEEVGA